MKIIKYLKDPKLLKKTLYSKFILKLISSDEKFIKIKYKLEFDEELDLNHPITFNQKLQWLKLNDRKDIYTTMADKFEAKDYVAGKIGKEYIIPNLGVFESFDEIDFDKLPNTFVIKCTHDSGGLVICHDKNKLNISEAKKKIENSLKTNYYYHGREWPYKNIKPRIIVEKFMQDKKQKSMIDYKFFCFNGEPKILYISSGLENHSTARMSFLDMDYKEISLKRKDYKKMEVLPPKPKNFEKMKEFAALLSKDIPHLRVDFYEINDCLYFGELTFFTCSGLIPFEDESWDLELGKMLKIPTDYSA